MAVKQTALLIGGSKGVALDVAKRLAGRGVNLVLIARGEQGLALAKDLINGDSDVVVATRSVDLYDHAAVDSLIESLNGDDRHFNYLINAAGYFKPIPFGA